MVDTSGLYPDLTYFRRFWSLLNSKVCCSISMVTLLISEPSTMPFWKRFKIFAETQEECCLLSFFQCLTWLSIWFFNFVVLSEYLTRVQALNTCCELHLKCAISQLRQHETKILEIMTRKSTAMRAKNSALEDSKNWLSRLSFSYKVSIFQ